MGYIPLFDLDVTVVYGIYEYKIYAKRDNYPFVYCLNTRSKK